MPVLRLHVRIDHHGIIARAKVRGLRSFVIDTNHRDLPLLLVVTTVVVIIDDRCHPRVSAYSLEFSAIPHARPHTTRRIELHVGIPTVGPSYGFEAVLYYRSVGIR